MFGQYDLGFHTTVPDKSRIPSVMVLAQGRLPAESCLRAKTLDHFLPSPEVHSTHGLVHGL